MLFVLSHISLTHKFRNNIFIKIHYFSYSNCFLTFAIIRKVLLSLYYSLKCGGIIKLLVTRFTSKFMQISGVTTTPEQWVGRCRVCMNFDSLMWDPFHRHIVGSALSSNC